MKNSFSSQDHITIKLKTKTNTSNLYQHARKKLIKSINDQCPDHTIQSSIHKNKQGKISKGISQSNKLSKKSSQANVIVQNLPSSHPMSHNSRRLQQQLQLFRFDDKIQEIQIQQIQQLINHQIKASKQKELQKISQLLNNSPVHPNNSNAFRLFKHSNTRPINGNRAGYDHRYGNKNVQRNESGGSKIGYFGASTDEVRNASELLQKKKDTKSVIVHECKKTQGDNDYSKTNKSFKPTASVPTWQRNIFHQKIISRQNQSKQSTNKTYLSSTSQNASFFNSQTKRPSESPQKLSQIQQSLNFLKNKSLSIKKNYEFFISKSNVCNPQVQEQLIDQLNKSKMNERLLLDSNNKSFSGYCKMKSYIYNRTGTNDKTMGQMFRQQNQSGNDLYRNATNITSYKFSNLKPLKLRLSKKNKNQLLLFDQPLYPKVNRPKMNQSSLESQHEDCQSEIEISPKFTQIYRQKNDSKEIEKYIAERRQISRETGSPYHQLSAWN